VLPTDPEPPASGEDEGAAATDTDPPVDSTTSGSMPAATSTGEDDASDEVGGPVPAPDIPVPDPPPTGGPGCGASPPNVVPSLVESFGDVRTFVLDVPADYDPEHAYPVIFGWHGTGHQGADARAQMGLLAATGGQAIVVYPDGDLDAPVWQFPGGAGVTDPDRDILLFDVLLDMLDELYCIDRGRVFATGFSQGAYLTNALACARPDMIRAIAPVAGGGPWQCAGSPMAARIVVGSDDPIAGPQSQYGYDNSALLSRDFWLAKNGCVDMSTPTSPEPCARYVCPPGLAVDYCEFVGGHVWWSQATEAAVSFFDEQQ
jgi:polyhydroxybutyrate depolymerase